MMDQDTKNWQDLASYLADCIAATAYSEFCLKSTSKYERKRHLSICLTAKKGLEHGYIAGHLLGSRESVIKRLQNVIDTFGEKA